MAAEPPDAISILFNSPPEETIRAVNAWVAEGNADAIALLLAHKDSHTYYKHLSVRYAIWGLLRLGIPGLERLRKAVSVAPGHIYPKTILQAVMHVAQGKLIPLRYPPQDKSEIVEPMISTELRHAAKQLWYEMVLESMNDVSQFFSLMAIAWEGAGLGNKDDAAMVLAGIRDISLTINHSLIARFQSLVDAEQKEEVYQRFLQENPVFLDPLAIEVIPKSKLGSEFVTDFVVRMATGDYLVVEIEKPQDQIFTKGNDFTAKFSHALGQVLDFHEWIEQNISYAQTRLPEISEPHGLVVMGRRTFFSQRQQRKFARFNSNSRRITVLTYDDLVTKGERLYANLLRPSVSFEPLEA